MKDGKLHAVVGIAGILGIGDREVLAPFDQLHIGAENEVTTDLTSDELAGMEEFDYDTSDVEILSSRRPVDQATQ